MTIKLDIGKKGIRKAWDSEKMTKCTPNDTNSVHLYAKCVEFVRQSEAYLLYKCTPKCGK